MFGIGKHTKGAFRWAWNAVSDLPVAIQNPEALRIFKAHENENLSADELWHVSLPLNAMYRLVPKAASSTVLTLLSRSISGGEPDGDVHRRSVSKIPGPRQVGLVKFAELLKDPDCIRFTFVRHPYARVISCWHNRVSDRRSSDRRSDISFIRKSAKELGVPLRSDQPVELEQFVRIACETAHVTPDGHWRLMSHLVPENVHYQLIGKVENFDADLAELQALLKTNFGSYSSKNVTRKETGAEQLSAEQRKMIYRAYQQDFDRFKYAQ